MVQLSAEEHAAEIGTQTAKVAPVPSPLDLPAIRSRALADPGKLEHEIQRCERRSWQNGSIIRCAIICECGFESADDTWAKAGEGYDAHAWISAAKGEALGEPVQMDPKPGETLAAWREWYKSGQVLESVAARAASDADEMGRRE